jgi:hypothetical protein
MVVAQYSTRSVPTDKGQKRPGGGGGENPGTGIDRPPKRQFTGARVTNTKCNKTFLNYEMDQKGKIFNAMKGRNTTCPKLGQLHICGKYHVRGWCTDDCDRIATHVVLQPDVEKKFNKWCQAAVGS